MIASHTISHFIGCSRGDSPLMMCIFSFLFPKNSGQPGRPVTFNGKKAGELCQGQCKAVCNTFHCYKGGPAEGEGLKTCRIMCGLVVTQMAQGTVATKWLDEFVFGIYGEVSISWQLEIIARSIVLEVSKTHVEDRNTYGSPWFFLIQQDKKRMDVHCILIQPIWKTTRTVFSASLVCGLVLIEMCHLVRSCSTVSLFFCFLF